MSPDCGFASDSVATAAKLVYGSVLARAGLLQSGFTGAGGHHIPVAEFPNAAFYHRLEDYAPRALLVQTKSTLVPAGTPVASIISP